MLTYEVNLKVQKEVAGAFAQWLPEHVEQVLACEGFVSADWCKTKAHPEVTSSRSAEENMVEWTIQYKVRGQKDLELYLEQRAPKMQEEAMEKFGGKFEACRRVLEPMRQIVKPDEKSETMLSDFPKIHCLFIRQTFPINHEDWKRVGKSLGLRQPEVYLVVDRINPGYEWVFEDPDTIAVEKLNGTNVKIRTERGRLVVVQNRLNVMDPLQIMKGKSFIVEGIFQAIGKNYVKEDGEQAGEVIGPKLQSNPYELDTHLWYPFEKMVSDLQYRSFHEHERNFDNWSAWFKEHLYSRFFTKRAAKLGIEKKVLAEGVVFYNLRRRSEQKTWMAKLRRDMYPWYYDSIDIQGYDKVGRNEVEDQDKLD